MTTLRNELLLRLWKKNPRLSEAIQQAIFKSRSSKYRKDTIFNKRIQNLLIFFIYHGERNESEVFLNLETNKKNLENTFLHTREEKTKVGMIDYYLNIDLDDKKIYYSKEFLNENQQITRDIFEIELTNIGKEILKKNFRMIHDECSKCNSSRNKNLIKLEIPFPIAHGRSISLEKERNARNNKRLDYTMNQCFSNTENESNKSPSKIEQNIQNNDKRIVIIENQSTNIYTKRKLSNELNESPQKRIKYDFSGKGSWI